MAVLFRWQSDGTDTLQFSYDGNGNAVSVKYNGTYYYYVYNGQGDVVKLIDGDGVSQVEYTYDTWGACSVTGSLANTLGAKNPFRYRGYVYDTETRLYYLESRYYDPETGRFISSDTLMSTGQSALGYNMFAYCLNNPVNMSDTMGTFSLSTLFSGISLISIGVAAIAVAATVLTCGAAAPLMVGVAAVTATAGAATVINGTAEADPEIGEVAAKRVVQTFENETEELVHVTAGGDIITATPEHPFYVPQRGWVGAIELRAGDILVQVNGEYAVVERIEHELLETLVTVYNFEVEGFHTYFVGDAGVLVHNRCVPKEAYDTVEYAKANNGKARSGYKGNRTFENREKLLPREGMPYKEYDIYPFIENSKRGLERVLIGSNNTTWYTPDHYRTFIQMN